MSESTIIQTKYGTAKINDKGYYQITSGKEGNHRKLLHRLIFEDYYNIKLNEEFPEGIILHHNDENKLNNEIWNLIPMTREEHQRLHHTGKPMPEHVKQALLKVNLGKKLSEEQKQKIRESHVDNSGEKNPRYGAPVTLESRKKMSKIRNSSGFYRVSIRKRPNMGDKISWEYVYRENRKVRTLSSVNLLKLKEKVLSKGLDWFIIDLENAKKTLEKYGYDKELLL